MQLPLLCRNSRAIALVEPAGWLAGCLTGRQNASKFQILKFIVDQIFKLFAVFNKVTSSLEQYECLSWYSPQKPV